MGETTTPVPLESLTRSLEDLRPRVKAFLIGKARSRQDAEDLTQQTMMIAFQHLENFRGECPLSHWVFRIAARACLRYYRRLRGAEVPLDEIVDLGPQRAQRDDPEETPDLVDGRLWLEKVLRLAQAVCTQVEFRVIMMSYQLGSLDEVGEILKMNGATVRSHFLRGRSNLIANLILEEPELVGGEAVVRQAIDRVVHQPDGFTKQELDALKSPSVRSKAYRSACLKIAKHLPNPLVNT